jgi:hypothetical protein
MAPDQERRLLPASRYQKSLGLRLPALDLLLGHRRCYSLPHHRICTTYRVVAHPFAPRASTDPRPWRRHSPTHSLPRHEQARAIPVQLHSQRRGSTSRRLLHLRGCYCRQRQCWSAVPGGNSCPLRSQSDVPQDDAQPFLGLFNSADHHSHCSYCCNLHTRGLQGGRLRPRYAPARLAIV